MLENHAYVLAELIDVRSGRGNQLSLETDFSGGRFLQQVQAAQEGTFTGTGRAYDEDHFTPVNVRGDIVDCRHGVEFLNQMADLEHGSVSGMFIHCFSVFFPVCRASS